MPSGNTVGLYNIPTRNSRVEAGIPVCRLKYDFAEHLMELLNRGYF